MIITVFFPLFRCASLDHVLTTVPTTYKSRKQINRFSFRSDPGIYFQQTLYILKTLFWNDCFMCIFYSYPVFSCDRRTLLHLIINLSVFALNHCAYVKFILQNTVDGSDCPFRIRTGTESAVIIHPPASLIFQWRQNSHFI